MKSKPSQNSKIAMVRDASSAPDNAVLTCTSLQCPERKSVCCGARSKTATESEMELGISQFYCAKCIKKFAGGKCTAGERNFLQIGALHCFGCHKNFPPNEKHICAASPSPCTPACGGWYKNCNLCHFENGNHSWECPRKKENEKEHLMEKQRLQEKLDWFIKVHDLLDEYGYGKGSKERSKLLALTARLYCFIIDKEK